MAETPWQAEGVSHLALVDAYYASGSIRVRQASLHPPLKPFFSEASAISDASEGESNRAKKKRKKLKQQQLQLQELIASGKFVPLGVSTTEALANAHEVVLSSKGWQPDMSSTGSTTGDVACVNPEIVDSGSHANTTDAVAVIQHNNTACVMPPHTSFTIGDVREVLSTKAASALGPFQLIVMDPPWENKSVDRKRCYTTFHHRELLKIDVPSLSMPVGSGDGDDGTVLAIWVTNRPIYMTFILEELLPAWGFTLHATWYWLKVCMSGELVSPLSSSHRLPVEKLVVATRSRNAEARERLCSRLGHTPKVVVSVPLRHSWKPPPECFFPHEMFTGRKLEVFARELRPHFVSVGNEPLKFQPLRLFEPNTASTPENKRNAKQRERVRKMKTTPTRRRRRDNGVMESWANTGDGDAAGVVLPAAPVLSSPPHQAAAMRNGVTTAASSAVATGTPTPSPAPELDRPTQLNVPALGEMQSVETILAATELLQRLDRLQAELERGTQDVHLAHDYRASCAEIITTFPWLALSKELDQRLWSSWQRELAALESCLSAAGDGVEGKARVEKQLRDALYVALSSYGSLIQKLKTSAVGAKGLDPTTTLLVHRLSLSHAHVLYALEIHSASQNHKNWRIPEQFYERARRWGVAQGETHYHLARIVLHDGRCADALYHLLRSRVADVAFDSPGSLADQYVHIATLRSSDSSEEASLPSEAACWLQLDRAVLAVVAPYFGQEQDFIAQRRAPRELALALCNVLDSVCVDDASRVAGEDTSAATESLKIVRIVSLLVACACLSKDFVAPSSSVVPSENDFVSVKNPRAIELIVSFVNALLHRALGAITSPLRTTKQKEHALQLTLPPINVAFSWLIKLQWREMVAEATRTSCEQLSTMMLTGIIAGGFLAPLEEPGSIAGQEQAATTVLVEAIELCGLPCFAGIDGMSTLSVDPDAGLEVSDDEALLQCRIGKFLSQVEAFMTPRPAVAAVMAEVEPSTPTASTTMQASPPVQASAVAHVANGLEQAAISARETSSTIVPDGRGNASGTRELWTPAKLTSAAASSKNSKPAKSASVPKPVAVPATLKPKTEERVVVLDAANIAMRHGLQRRFSCRGIQLCAEFFIAQGNRVVAFLPDYCLDVDSDGAFRRRATASSGGRARRREGRCTITPDDRVLVEIMVDSGVVVLTPAMDSDDLYCIHYAKRYNAFLVTNDLFRDHISDTDGPKSRQTELRNWLQARRISYTWVGDEFLPNPNSAYEKLRSGSS